MGLPHPCNTMSLPRLKLALTGIKRVQAESSKKPSKTHLPVTLPVLKKIRELWDLRPSRRDHVMPRAAMILLLFTLFQSGEITLPAQDAFNTWIPLLSWGDVVIDKTENLQAIKVYLRHSKTNHILLSLKRKPSLVCYIDGREDKLLPYVNTS